MNKFPDMKGLQYGASFTGIFGRNRKAKFETFTVQERMKDSDPAVAAIPILEEVARLWMTKLGVKSVQGEVRIDCYERDIETGAIVFPGTTVHRFTF